ncbi:MAG: cob(I)yrinic acid a,c-diamide adenosyltransferase [Cytophagaceae bacterium]
MKIYTKTGDKGTTSLLGGLKVSKSDVRLHAYGTVDELNSYIGLLSDQPVSSTSVDFLRNIQNILFTIGSHLAAGPDNKFPLPPVEESYVLALEGEIDSINALVPELKSFILPGGHPSISHCHIARCVCRRAERLVISMSEICSVDPLIVKFLNRLSDYLFMLARKMAHDLDIPEIPWKPQN